MSYAGVAPSGHILTSNGQGQRYVALSGDIAGIAGDTILSRIFGAPVDTSAVPSNGLVLGYNSSSGRFTLINPSGSSTSSAPSIAQNLFWIGW